MKWRGVLQCTSLYMKLVLIYIYIGEKQGKEEMKKVRNEKRNRKILRKHQDKNIANDERKSNVNKLYNFMSYM